MKRELTIEQLADALDLAQSTIRRYQSKGMPFEKGKGKLPNKYNQDEVASWMLSKGLTGEQGTPMAGGGFLSEEMKAQTVRKLKAQADKYEQELLTAKMDYKLRIGELLEKVEVEQGQIARVLMVKNGLLGLPSAVSCQLVGLSAVEIQNRLEAEMYRLLEHFSKQ